MEAHVIFEAILLGMLLGLICYETIGMNAGGIISPGGTFNGPARGAVPEPSAFALLGVAFLCLVALRRRSR